MADLIYYCKKENNVCSKKESCKRYLQSDDKECRTTLFKMSCTESNNHPLYIKNIEE